MLVFCKAYSEYFYTYGAYLYATRSECILLECILFSIPLDWIGTNIRGSIKMANYDTASVKHVTLYIALLQYTLFGVECFP